MTGEFPGKKVLVHPLDRTVTADTDDYRAFKYRSSRKNATTHLCKLNPRENEISPFKRNGQYLKIMKTSLPKTLPPPTF